MNSQPDFQQNQPDQVQGTNRRCKCKFTYLDLVAAILGGILGGFIVSELFRGVL